MTVPSYQPQIDLTVYETAAKQKWRFGMLLALAVLGGFGLVFMYYRWFGNILPGASNEVSLSTSDPTAERPGHLRPATSRRTNSKHPADALVPPVSDAQLTLASGI